MPLFLLTDFDAPNFALEEKLFADAGMRFVTAQARSEDEVIAAATACNADGLLIQYQRKWRMTRCLSACAKCSQSCASPQELLRVPTSFH